MVDANEGVQGRAWVQKGMKEDAEKIKQQKEGKM